MKLICAIIIFSWFPLLADACSCAFPTFEEQMRMATSIFTGKVVKTELETEGRTRVELKSINVWKGTTKETIIIYTAENSAMCGYPFQEGTEYLVYATGEKELKVNLCSRTKSVVDADEDLDKLDAARRTGKASKRDPFTDMRGDRMVIENKLVPRALNITNAVIVGITKKSDGFVALIRATNNKVYFLKVGDKLHDGVVVKIDNNAVTFRRNRSAVLVRKQLRPFPD